MLIAIVISVVLVLGTAIVHFEGLRVASRFSTRSRVRILMTLIWIFIIQLVEIAFYAFGYWFADKVVDVDLAPHQP